MKNIIPVFILLFSTQLNAQTDYKGKLSVPFPEYTGALKTSYGLSVYQNIGRDSIVLKDKWEYFWTIQLFNNNKLLFEFKEDVDNVDLEIDVFKNGVCVIFGDYHIFKVDKRPNACNAYLIFKREGGSFSQIGVTETTSAFIFGDIDGDNKFEIGGFKYLFEGDVDSYGTREEVYKDRFRIFEINDSITRETGLEAKFSKAIMGRFDFPHSGITKSYILTKPMNVDEIKEESLRKYAGLSVYELWEGSLDGILKSELRLMRNEIFAAHGHIFKSGDLIAYFSKQLWYKPCCSDVTDKLSETERFNVAFIKENESK